MAKIFVGLPIFNFQDFKVKRLQNLMLSNSPHTLMFQEVVGLNVEQARKVLIDKFLQTDCEYFLNIDADITMDLDGCPIDRLVQCNKDVVGAIYFFKSPPCQPVYRPLELQEIYEKEGKFPDNFTFSIPNDLFEVKWMGNGFKLVKREVIKKVREKFLVPNMGMEYKGEYLAEDWAFDQRARELGFSIWADPKIKTYHWGSYGYSSDDFKKYYGNKSK